MSTHRRPSGHDWITVLAAVVGGMLLGLGVGRILGGRISLGGVSALIGALLLWWALADRRRADPDAPESEADGSHTIE